MPTQKLIWTALPNGAADGKLRLSALVSPRLLAETPEEDELRSWPAWVDWTTFVRDATFRVAFDGGPTVEARFDRAKLEPELWRALFGPDSFVRSHVVDNYSGRTIISYPAGQVYRSIKGLYQAAGTRAPQGLPAAAPLHWETEYLALGTGNQPKAGIQGIATSGRFVYATHHVFNPAAPRDPNRPFGRLVKIDTATDPWEVVAEVGVGDAPISVAVMPDSPAVGKNRLYVVNSGVGKTQGGTTIGGYSLTIVTDEGTAFGRPTEIKLGAVPQAVAVSRSRNHVYVTNPVQRKLHILDGEGKELSAFVPDQPEEGEREVVSVAVDDRAGAVYVTVAEAAGAAPPPDTLLNTRVIKLVPQDERTYRRVWTTSVERMRSSPPRIAVDPERERILVTHTDRKPGGPEQPGITVLASTDGSRIAIPDMGRGRTLDVGVSTHFGTRTRCATTT